MVSQQSLPKYITSDYDPQFCGHFWDVLVSLLDTILTLSIALKPQTNGMAEVTNHTMEQLLHIHA